MYRTLSMLVLITILVFGVAGTNAQDGLTDEQNAALDRIFEAASKLDEYNSFREVSTELMTMNLAVAVLGQEIVLNRTTQLDTDSQIIQLDEMTNVSTTAVAEYESVQSGMGQDESATFILNAEIRLVDDVLYLSAEYETSEGEVPELPMMDGWIAVEDVSGYEIFDILSLEDYLDEDDDLFEDRELFRGAVSDLTIEPSELEDGTLVDIITVSVGSEAFSEAGIFEGDSDDPMQAALSAIFGESLFTLTVVLGEDNTPYEVTLEFDVTAEELDASELIPDLPASATMNLELIMVNTQQFSDFNADFEPAIAPME